MKYEFDAVLLQVEGLDATYIEPPFDVEKELGAKRVKVRALIDGTEYRGSIVRMGGCYMLGIPQSIRKAIGKGPGDKVRIALEKDEQERLVALPEELAGALKANQAANDIYSALSFSRRKKFADWVNEASKSETRVSRAGKTISMLLEGKAMK